MSKRKYVKKEKVAEVSEVKLSNFNKDLFMLTKIKPPKKDKDK